MKRTKEDIYGELGEFIAEYSELEVIRVMAIDSDTNKAKFAAILEDLEETNESPEESSTDEAFIKIILDKDETIDLLAYAIYELDIPIETIQEAQAEQNGFLDASELLNLLSSYSQDIDKIGEMSEEDLLSMLSSIEKWEEGTMIKVIASYNNNTIVKYKEEIAKHKESLYNMSLEELEVEFIELLTVDNLATVSVMLNLFKVLFKENKTLGGDTINKNMIFMDNLLVTLKDRKGIEEVNTFTKYLCSVISIAKEA